jgi:hypothetical protein
MNLKLRLCLLLCILGFHPARAFIPGLKTDGHLDMDLLRNAYFESDFGKVRTALEGFLKKHPKDVTRDEKIFTHLYLGIFCAADSSSQAKAERHFLALLQLTPDVGIVDLFVPLKTQDLFERIRRDYFERQANETQAPASPNAVVTSADNARPDSSVAHASGSLPSAMEPATTGMPTEAGIAQESFDSVPSADPSQPSAAISAGGHAWVWWTMGSAAIAAAGMGVYALVAVDASPAPHRALADGTLK